MSNIRDLQMKHVTPTQGFTVAKRVRFFIRHPDSGEPWVYCGDLIDKPALAKAFGDFVFAEAEGEVHGLTPEKAHGTKVSIEVRVEAMTNSELDGIPDM